MEVSDYTTVYASIKIDIVSAVLEYDKKAEILLICRFSDNPKDNHLYLVMAKAGYCGGYNTWIYNTSLGGLHEGHYDMNFVDALTDMSNRVR